MTTKRKSEDWRRSETVRLPDSKIARSVMKGIFHESVLKDGDVEFPIKKLGTSAHCAQIMDGHCKRNCLPHFFGHGDEMRVSVDARSGMLAGASSLMILPSDLSDETIGTLRKNLFRTMPRMKPPKTTFHVTKLGANVVCKLKVLCALEYDPQSTCTLHNSTRDLEYKIYLCEKHVLTIRCQGGKEPRISFTASVGDTVCPAHLRCIEAIFKSVPLDLVTCGPTTNILDGPSSFVRLPLQSIPAHGKIGEMFPLLKHNQCYQRYSDETFHVSALGPDISCRLLVAPAVSTAPNIATCPIHNKRSMHTYYLYRSSAHVCTIQWKDCTGAEITDIAPAEKNGDQHASCGVTQDEVIEFLRNFTP